MSHFRILLAAIVAAATGCEMLHPRPPIDVTVRDAETQEPIPDARVAIWHAALHAEASRGMTGPDGTVRLSTPPADDTLVLYEVMAKGYLSRQTDRPVASTPTGVVLEVFAEPRPFVELIVPTGFRGAIHAKIQVRSDLPIPPGQRQYVVNVPDSGAVDIVLPPIFTRGMTPEIRTRYADGTALSRTVKDNEIGCHWLLADGDYMFVIGYKYEADNVRRSLKTHPVDTSAAGSGGR